jgi:hypothetical protein
VEVDMVFFGLCSFLNLNSSNSSMGEPSVILIRTDAEAVALNPALLGSGTLTVHTPFMAFDSKTVRVDDATGFNSVKPPVIARENLANFDFPGKLRRAASFRYLPLANAELTIQNAPGGALTVDPSYAKIAKKDVYWPGTANQWNRDFVPKATQKPSSSVVAVFLRFGGGTIYAGHISKNKWEFRFQPEDTISTHKDTFAREVHYKFPIQDGELLIGIGALDDPTKPPKLLRFSPVVANGSPMTIWIGNSTERGIAFATQHVSPRRIGDGGHFVFLNQVVKAAPALGVGPIPYEIAPQSATATPAKTAEAENAEEPGGEDETGFCGPHNANGGPP